MNDDRGRLDMEKVQISRADAFYAFRLYVSWVRRVSYIRWCKREEEEEWIELTWEGRRLVFQHMKASFVSIDGVVSN